MTTKKDSFPLGDFLKELRERKGESLKKVESATGINNAYLSQLETGIRRKLPIPETLKKLAEHYNVTVKELLEKAGYVEESEIEETYAQKIDRLFRYVTNNPKYKHGFRLKDELTTDVKKFVIEMYEKATGEKLLL